MQDQLARRALVIRGGWEGHAPVEATDRSIPFLEANGFDVDVHDDLDVYPDADVLSRTDPVVQYWTLTDDCNDVLATSSFRVGDDTRGGRTWLLPQSGPGCGPAAACSCPRSDTLEDLDHPGVRQLTPAGSGVGESLRHLA